MRVEDADLDYSTWSPATAIASTMRLTGMPARSLN
jgi:hypothetical protein